VEAVQRRAARYVHVANNHRNRSSVSNIIQRLKWRPLADRRKDPRLVMLYKIDRELVAINKENRLIPPGRKTRQAHNRSFQIPSSCIDTRKMSFFPRTVRYWNLLAPDIVEMDTPEAFKAIVAKSAVHINIYEITWIVPLCYYNGHIRNPLTSVLFLIKTWHKRYLFVKDELINTYRLLSLDYHLFGINI
jgi:hypothetical protein